ncbi:MAG: TraR/DksA C4-type zinc finger protein [Coriobacteriia bacterium]|nr:TraR/DksA C4-type zinc finger protein [Coriobacteriia bacterium]MBS5478702.1 TraR/DksA C4-type zinc finger protein [Coriobacteriia bacterium]
MTELVTTFEQDLERAIAFHGHLCAGQVIGVRMARLALRYFGIEDPAHYRDLIAFVECDRCLADAVITVCHCNLGRRRLKWYDYGVMSATFYDMATKQAIRISQPQGNKCPGGTDPVAFFADLSDDVLFNVDVVELPELTEADLPGGKSHGIPCASCGELIHDGRGIERDGKLYCKKCAGEHVYYREVRRLTSEEVAAGVRQA